MYHLFAKHSKCFFGKLSVGYLGHIISPAGVAMDPAKVEAVEACPRPTIARALRGFLGLIGYYRKFIAGYGGVAAPLTMLLKREVFSWTLAAEEAFLALKRLTLPVMKARRRHSTGYVHPSTTDARIGWFETMSKATMFVSVIKPNTCIPLVFFSHILFLNMCGATSPWTLLRAFRVWAASP